MSSQPGGAAPRSAGAGDDNALIPIIFGCVVVGAIGPAVWAAVSAWVMPRLRDSSNEAARLMADWWSANWWLAAVWAAGLLGIVVTRWCLLRRTRLRRRQWQALIEGLVPRMGRAWVPEKHLQVRRWRGLRPVVLRVALTAGPAVMDREWRLGVSTAVRDLIGQIRPIRWPEPPPDGLVVWRKPPWIEVRVVVPPQWWRRTLSGWRRRLWGSGHGTGPAQDAPDAAAAMEEKLVAALAGLVPQPRPKATGDCLVVEYGETTRDQSPAWRFRVVDQVSARLGTVYRASWDRQHRRFLLQPVPELPHPISWSEQTALLLQTEPGRWVAGYGTDENGRIVAWEPGDREPHAMFSGDPGTGKSEAMKALIDTLLLRGALIAIIDPKQRDFAEYLGKPGVVCVATAVKDQVGTLVDLEAEMMRRTSAAALTRLNKQFPDLEDGRYHPDRRPPAQAAIDEVPLIVVLDELTFHTAQVQEWWQRLSAGERAGWGAEKSRQAPMLTIPSRIVALARAIKIHMLIGVQRPDAGNFGGSTTMRDNIKHMASMGRQSAIGSEMQWGDRRTGSEVEIDHPGEGVSNGLRLSTGTGEPLGRGVPGRFKAWYAADAAETEEFWARVAAVAPDATLVRLPHVSNAARDPVAAAAALRERAYEEYAVPLEPAPATDVACSLAEDRALDRPRCAGPERPVLTVVAAPGNDRNETARWDPLLVQAAELVVEMDTGSASMLQRELRVGYERGRQLMTDLESVGIVGPVQGRKARRVKVTSLDELHGLLRERGVNPPAIPPLRLVAAHRARPGTVEQEEQPQPELEKDEGGRLWEPVPATAVVEGDTVQFGEIRSAVVVDTPQLLVDEFDGVEVIRLVIDVDGGEEVVDLCEDETIYRQLP